MFFRRGRVPLEIPIGTSTVTINRPNADSNIIRQIASTYSRVEYTGGTNRNRRVRNVHCDTVATVPSTKINGSERR